MLTEALGSTYIRLNVNITSNLSDFVIDGDTTPAVRTTSAPAQTTTETFGGKIVKFDYSDQRLI